jgi:hypothetical protein
MPARTKLPFKDCPFEDVSPTEESRARGKEIASVSANELTGEKIAMDTIPSFAKNRKTTQGVIPRQRVHKTCRNTTAAFERKEIAIIYLVIAT